MQKAAATDARYAHSLAKKQSLAEYEQARQAHILAVQFEDEMRVREFQVQKQLEQQVRR